MTVLAWQRGGQPGGPPVVLLHAWAATGTGDWDVTGWVAHLAEAGFDVLVPDLPGHGDSADVAPPPDGEPAAWTAEMLRHDLAGLGVGQLAAVGFAEGCLVAAHLAVVASPRVASLALLLADDRAGMPHGEEIAAALSDARARVWHPEAADAVSRARRDRRHDLTSLAVWARQVAWPAAPRLGALPIPVLLAVGAGSERRDRAPRLAALFHDARLVTVPGDGRTALAAASLARTASRFLTERAAASP